MSLLSTVQRAATLCNQPRPTAVSMTTDRTAALMAELARVEVEHLVQVADWSGVLRETSFTTVAGIDQPNALPVDFLRFAFSTSGQGQIYDLGRREGIAGPANQAQWNEVTNGFSGWLNTYQIAGGKLQMAPSPGAGRQFRMRYITSNLYKDMNGVAKPDWSNDNDVCLIPENVVALGVVWRWKNAKGLEYAEDLRNAEMLREQAIGTQSGGRRMLTVGNPRMRWDANYPFPGVLGH